MNPYPTPVNTEATHRRGRVVILVEDDEGLRGALERVLRASGFETRTFPSAEAALADPSPRQPDCLVADLDLPMLSGLDLIDCLRNRGVTAPALLISAHDKPLMRKEVSRRGVAHFLAKPFLGTALVAMLDEMLREGPACRDPRSAADT